MPKCELPESIPLHAQRLNCKADVYELEDHVEEKGLNLNWLTKFGLTKKNILASFPSCPLESAKSNMCFPIPCHLVMKGQNETPLG